MLGNARLLYCFHLLPIHNFVFISRKFRAFVHYRLPYSVILNSAKNNYNWKTARNKAKKHSIHHIFSFSFQASLAWLGSGWTSARLPLTRITSIIMHLTGIFGPLLSTATTQLIKLHLNLFNSVYSESESEFESQIVVFTPTVGLSDDNVTNWKYIPIITVAQYHC